MIAVVPRELVATDFDSARVAQREGGEYVADGRARARELVTARELGRIAAADPQGHAEQIDAEQRDADPAREDRRLTDGRVTHGAAARCGADGAR